MQSPRVFAEVSTPSALLQAMRQGTTFRLIYRPRTGDRARHFAAVCAIVRAVRGVTLFVDELDMFTRPGWMSEELRELVEYGRHHRVALICTARSVTQVPRAFTAACTKIVCFAIFEPRQIKDWAERASTEFAEALPNLPKFKFKEWSPQAFGGK